MSVVADKQEAKREEFAARLAVYFIENGLSDIGIRALADAAGTSDRMLIYYFGSKDKLIAYVLEIVIADFTRTLDSLVGNQELAADQLMQRLVSKMNAKAMRPALTLWFEIIGLALRGEQPYKAIAQKMMFAWEAWIAQALITEDKARAAELFAQLEGSIMIGLLKE